jgi:uncharacterized protein YndB with AHSA1/START domain
MEMITQEKAPAASSVTVERTLNAPPAEVYRAFVTPQALRDWFCNASQVDARLGGRIYLAWSGGYHTAGKITRLERNKVISYTWRGNEEQTTSQVTVEIEGNEGGESLVRVVHSAPDVNREWLDEAKRDWTEALESLQAMLEKGIDLRLARRPMFGLNGADIVDDALAEKLELPVREGIRLTGLVDGMGAQRAGIRPGDILVRLGGRPTVVFSDIGAALDKHKAGEIVEAELYRDGERITIPVELTARAMPTLPDTAEGLAAEARKLYAEVDKELDELFEEVTEAQADYRPAPDEWNAKEILAHLAASERDVHTWIASLAEDSDIEQPFHSNDTVRVRSIVEVHPTIPEMVALLKQSEAEVVAAIELLRSESVARRHLFRSLALWITSFQDHHREHFGLIKSMLESARQ